MAGKRSCGPFVWKEEYSVNLDLIDNHHKKFIDILNNLHSVISHKPSREDISDIFFSLVYYAENHLVNEEIYLKESEYSSFNQHKEKHNSFVGRIIKFQKDFKEGKQDVCEDLYDFLKDWLKNHILKDDREAISSLKEDHNK